MTAQRKVLIAVAVLLVLAIAAWGIYRSRASKTSAEEGKSSGFPGTLAVFRSGQWLVDYDGDHGWNDSKDRTFSFGLPSDLPVVGDWDASGKLRIGVFRNGSWLVDYDGDYQWNSSKDRVYNFGLPGDLPVVGDWDGSGKLRIGVFRNGSWLVDYDGDYQWNSSKDRVYNFGLPGDKAIVIRHFPS
jgi:hypothetical protein